MSDIIDIYIVVKIIVLSAKVPAPPAANSGIDLQSISAGCAIRSGIRFIAVDRNDYVAYINS